MWKLIGSMCSSMNEALSLLMSHNFWMIHDVDLISSVTRKRWMKGCIVRLDLDDWAILIGFRSYRFPSRERQKKACLQSSWSCLLPRLLFAFYSGLVLLAVIFACLCESNCILLINEIEECGYVCLDVWRSETAAKSGLKLEACRRNHVSNVNFRLFVELATNIWSRRIF